MRIWILAVSLLILTGCDQADQMKKPRTLIIAGMPVYEHDYRLSVRTDEPPIVSSNQQR